VSVPVFFVIAGGAAIVSGGLFTALSTWARGIERRAAEAPDDPQIDAAALAAESRH
jgi:hypothetical protein